MEYKDFRLWVFEKWATCQKQGCKVNVTKSWEDLANCCVCTGHTDKERYGKKSYDGYDYSMKEIKR